ncbi:MAG: secretin N-terminal domain-containing protein, partial [Gemmatimonadaceae bacterium]
MTTFVRTFIALLVVTSPIVAQPPGRPPAGGQTGQASRTPGDTGSVRRTPTGYVLDFQDQDIRVVLSAVAEAGDLNITYSNLPTKRVTLRMSKAVSHDELLNVLEGLAESNQLKFTQNGTFIRIEGVAIPTAQQLQQQQLQAQAAFAAQNQLRLFTYRLKHVSAITIAPVLMNLIIGSGFSSNTRVNGAGGNGQVFTIPGAIQIQGNPNGGRGGNASGGGRGNAAALQGLEQLQAITQAFVGAADANAIRNQLLNGGFGGAQPQQAASAPGTLSAAANDIRIVAEESTNSLMIRATAQDYQILTQLIQTVDLRPLQVLIEVTIAEVQRNKDLSVGISGSATSKKGNDTTSGSFPSAASARDFVLMLTGGKGAVNYNVAINALQARGDVKVLSMPVIIAQNNK